MTNKLLVSTVALMLAGGGAVLAQGTGGTEKQGGAGMQSPTGGGTAGVNAGSQMQAQTPTGDESTQPRRKGAQTHQVGQAGQENPSNAAQPAKRGEAGKSGEKQGQRATSPASPSKSKDTMGTEQGTGTAGTQGSATAGALTGKGQGTAESADLTSDKRSRITGVIKRENIRPEPNVSFSLSVGTAIPRTVHLHRLPREIVTVEPNWRAYEFILVGDEIVIVNPRNFEIVAVMPA